MVENKTTEDVSSRYLEHIRVLDLPKDCALLLSLPRRIASGSDAKRATKFVGDNAKLALEAVGRSDVAVLVVPENLGVEVRAK